MSSSIPVQAEQRRHSEHNNSIFQALSRTGPLLTNQSREIINWRRCEGENLEGEGMEKHVTMAAGLIGVKRQAVGIVVATLVKWNTTRRSFTHQFSQFALLQSWWRQNQNPDA